MLSEAEQAPGPVTPKGFSAPFRQFATLVLSEAEQLLARYASMQSACALLLVGPVWAQLLSFAEQEQAPSARVCSASAQLLLSFAEQEQEQEQGQQEFRSVTTPLLA